MKCKLTRSLGHRDYHLKVKGELPREGQEADLPGDLVKELEQLGLVELPATVTKPVTAAVAPKSKTSKPASDA